MHENNQDWALPLLSFMQNRQRAMLDLLQELTLIQSSSMNKPGLDQMVKKLAWALPDSLKLQSISCAEYGDMLLARSPKAAAGEKQLLLLGHTDTVFPIDTVFNFYRELEDRAHGPGVIDMKGGLVCGIYALLALEHFGLLDQIPVCMFFNSEEEIGSPASWNIICREADNSFAAFVLECGGQQGEIVTARKGRSGYKLQVQGCYRHAAQAGPGKPSAVLELAHKVIALEAENNPPDLTLNVGSIKGGIGANTVPGQAEALIDVRYLQEKDNMWLRQKLEQLIQKPVVQGTNCSLSYQTGRPPMPQNYKNQKLFNMVQSQAELLGQALSSEQRSGVSDANIVASRGVPVVDGLGPLGDLDHSEQEYMLIPSLAPRACLLALSIWRCCQMNQAPGF